MGENRQPRRPNLLRISIRTVLFVTAVVAAFLFTDLYAEK
jgi:hypothetical protein